MSSRRRSTALRRESRARGGAPSGKVGAFRRGIAMTTTIYGIKACDTMKKARAWLDEKGIAYAFHDYKSAGIDAKTLQDWTKKVGWEKLFNKAGTTFRKLPDADKADIDEAKALALMLAHPSMIKRPVLEHGRDLIVGFKPEDYAARIK
jgi:arsenate reductase